MRVSVELTVRPRSDTAEEPAPKPLAKAVGIDPLLSAEIERTASETLLMPAFFRLSADRMVTGEGVSVSVRRNSVPVTTMSFLLVSEASGEPVAAVEFCARAVSWAMAGLVVRRPPISAAGRMADAALPRNRAARMTDIL